MLRPLYSPEAVGRPLLRSSADGATIAFAGDYFMECGNEPGQFIGQILRGLEVAGVKGVKKSPAWSRAEKIEAMAERVRS